METVDQAARDLANKAIAELTTHEAVCTQRWEAARTSFQAGSKKMDELAAGQKTIINAIFWGIGISLTTLLGITGWMATRLADIAMN